MVLRNIKVEETSGLLLSDLPDLPKPKVKARKPIMKKEESVFKLDDKQIERRYSNINDSPIKIDLAPELINRTVSRAFFSAQYGGNTRQNYPRPKAEFVRMHGMDQFAFMKPEWGPFLPKMPGERGLCFARRTYEEVMPLFVKQDAGGWLYMGAS